MQRQWDQLGSSGACPLPRGGPARQACHRRRPFSRPGRRRCAPDTRESENYHPASSRVLCNGHDELLGVTAWRGHSSGVGSSSDDTSHCHREGKRSHYQTSRSISCSSVAPVSQLTPCCHPHSSGQSAVLQAHRRPGSAAAQLSVRPPCLWKCLGVRSSRGGQPSSRGRATEMCNGRSKQASCGESGRGPCSAGVAGGACSRCAVSQCAQHSHRRSGHGIVSARRASGVVFSADIGAALAVGWPIVQHQLHQPFSSGTRCA